MASIDTPLYEQIYRHIMNKIIDGEYKKGDRVPSEQELSKQFNVSRITSKKALDTLAENNIIERIRGKGSFVLNENPKLTLKGSVTQEVTEKSDLLMIGLILPDFSPNFGLEFVKHLEKACSEAKVHLLLKRSYGKVEKEAESIHALTKMGVDGLLIIPVHGQHYNNTLLQLVLNKFPIVLADRFLKGIPASSVCIDNSKASTELTKHLISLGHQKIAYVSPPLTGTSAIEERLQGYKMSFSYEGLRLNPDYMVTNLLSSLPSSYHSERYEALKKKDFKKLEAFILENPDVKAFVACEYELALMLYQVLTHLGKKIPEEYVITCFDSPKNPLSKVQFTHIKQDEKMLAKQSFNLLLNHIRGDQGPTQLFTDYRFIKGDTT